MKVVTFKMREKDLEKLDEFCRRVGLPRSYVIRSAVMKLLEEGKIELRNYSVRPLRRPAIRVRKVVLD